jgi:hypothetical protein
MQIIEFRTLYARYQSEEDWRQAEDILRCTPKFHNRLRYDGVMLHAEKADERFARLKGLYRCTLPSGAKHDIAYVRSMRRSKWKPQTAIKSATIVTEDKMAFVHLQFVIRGALLASTDLRTGSTEPNKDFFVVEVDEDMYLRLQC